MKVILFLLVFTGGQPNATLAPMPSMDACMRQRAALVQEILQEPKVTEFVVACHETEAGART